MQRSETDSAAVLLLASSEKNSLGHGEAQIPFLLIVDMCIHEWNVCWKLIENCISIMHC